MAYDGVHPGEIHLPLAHGMNEGVDPKLLPQGLLQHAENIRFRKDGRIGSRYGFATISGAPANVVAGAAYRTDHSIAIASRQAAATPAQAYTRLPSGSYTAAIGATSDIGGVRRFPVAANMTYFSASSSDVAYAPNASALVYAYVDEYTVTSSYKLTMLVVDAASHKLLGTTTVTANQPYNTKLVVVGQYVFCCWAELSTDVVKSYRWDTNGGGYVFTSTSTLATAHTVRSKYFDIAPLDSTHFLFCAQTSAVDLKWYSVDTTGAATLKATQTIAADVFPTLCKDYSTTNVYMAWAEGNKLYYGKWDSAGSVVTAKTEIGTDVMTGGNDIPAIGPHPTSGAVVVWVANASMGRFKIGGSVVYEGGGVSPRSKPFTVGSANYVWAATYPGGTVAVPHPPGYVLVSLDSTATDGDCDAIACQHDVPFPGTWDYRRSAAQIAAADVTSPGYCYCALPTLSPLTSGFAGNGFDSVRFEFGAYVDRLLPANIDGRTLFSGGRVWEYDGNSITAAGLKDGPELMTLTAGGGGTGSMDAGDYQYVGVWQWIDAQGNRHLSPPSSPVTVTAVATGSVAFSVLQPTYTAKDISLLVYRTTLTHPDIFQLANSALAIHATPGSTTAITYTDTFADATILVNEVLYSQGDRGGLSGTLPHDEPPPCKYIWTGNSRVILGGLENASEYQFSKLLFPGEPVTFSAEDFYKGRVPGDVTGVASLDGVWYVFTREAIYAVTGQGPADNGQGGVFDDPVRVPGEFGCISFRSIVETAEGLWFQARPDKLCLLPRGGGAPTWKGQPVRDTLTDHPFIISALVNQADNTVQWYCADADASIFVTIIYDSRIGEWSVDVTNNVDVAHTTNIYNDKIVVDGKFTETALYSDVGSTIVVIETFGDVRPFGPTGHGRNRYINLLGEFRSDCTVKIEMSYDSGVTYPDFDTWVFGTGGQAQTAGDSVTVRFLIPKCRGTTFRPRITITPTSVGEGFVLNDVSFEVFPEKGTTRLAAAYQR